MNITRHFSTFMLTIAVVFFAACEMMIPPFVGPTDRPDTGDNPKDSVTVEIDTIGWNIPAEAITIAEAREICAQLESGATTGTKYYVMGFVKKLHNKHAEGISGYGNAQFYMEDVQGANSSEDFLAYQVYGPNSQQLSDPNVVAVGDFVVLYGELTNYNGTYETVGRGAAYIWRSTNPLLNDDSPTPDQPTEPEDLVIPEAAKDWGIPADAIDVIKAREICSNLASGETSGTKYYVMGYVKKIHNKHAEGVSGYGNAQFYMENVSGRNSQNDFMAFQVYGINGKKISDPNVVAVGDFVVVYGELTNYNGTYETVGKGAAHIWRSTNPLLSDIVPEPEPEPEPEQPKVDSIFYESLATTASVEAFTAISVKGAEWAYNRRGKCVAITSNSTETEAWFITPALDLSGRTEATLSFTHKLTNAIEEAEQENYTVWVSNDYTGNTAQLAEATWTQLKGINYNATSFVESGDIAIPTAHLTANSYIAWKYTASTAITWSLQDVLVRQDPPANE